MNPNKDKELLKNINCKKRNSSLEDKDNKINMDNEIKFKKENR